MVKLKRFAISFVLGIIFLCLTFCCVNFIGNGKAEIVKAEVDGGAVYIKASASYTMRGGLISNTTGNKGGAVYVGNGATFTMNGGTIVGCSANYGGAIYVASGGKCYLNTGKISNCSASAGGNAIYVEEGGYLEMAEGFIIEGSGGNYTTSIKAINPLNVKRPVTITPYMNEIEQTKIKTFSNVKLHEVGLPTDDGCGWYEESAYTNQVITSDVVGVYAEEDTLNLYFSSHNWEVTAMYVGDNCQEEGGSEQKCVICSATAYFYDGGYYGDHVYEYYRAEESYAPSCEEWGVEYWECNWCLDYITVDLEPTGHDYTCIDSTTGETCQEEGIDLYECTKCTDYYEEPNGQFGDHRYDYFRGDLSYNATCVDSGLDYWECNWCTDYITYEIPPNVELHDYQLVDYHHGSCEPPYYNWEEYECSICQDSYVVDLGYDDHNYEEQSRSDIPCDEEGNSWIYYECTNCSSNYTEYGAWGGHDWVEDEANNYYWCTYCGRGTDNPATILPDTKYKNGKETELEIMKFLLTTTREMAIIKEEESDFDIKTWLDEKE